MKKTIFLLIGLIISAIFFVKIQPVSATGESITVTSPNGGEVWHPGETQRIRWNSSNVSSVQIYLYDPTVPESGGTIYVTPNNNLIAASLGYYDWTIPSLGQLPAVGGTSYKIRVQDANNANIQDSSDAPFSIVTAGTLSITTGSLPSGTVGIAYTASVSATGGTAGTGNYIWAATGLPPGLSIVSDLFACSYQANLCQGSGTIFGTPTTAGTYTVTITLTSGTQSVSKQFGLVIVVAGTLSITTDSLSIGTVGVAYTAYVFVTGGSAGTGNYIWTANGLPAGLSIVGDIFACSDQANFCQGSGTISGTPIVAGTYTVNITVTSGAKSTSKQLILVIVATGTLSITTGSLPGGTVGIAYTAPVSATGGSSSYMWSATGLPAGLSMGGGACTANTVPCQAPGEIYGTPAAASIPEIRAGAGTYTVTITVTSGTQSVSKQFSLVIELAGKPSITITYPNGGETLRKGQTYTFRWTSQGMSGKKVRVALYQKDLTPPLFENIAGTTSAESGWVSWTIPSSVAAKSNYYKTAVIYDSSTGGTAGESIVDYSDNFFSILEIETPPGGCLPDGTLLKLLNDPKIYVIINCQKKWIQNPEEFEQGGYSWSAVKETSSPVLQAYSDYMQATANLLQAIGQEKVYRLINGKALWIPTIAAFNAQGLKWEDIKQVDATEITKYPQAKLLQAAGDEKIYYITNSGLKRHIPNEEVFNSYGNNWADVMKVTPAEINSFVDSNLIKKEGDTKIYKLENGKKRWVETAAAFNRLGFNWNKVAPVNNTEFNAYPDGTAIE